MTRRIPTCSARSQQRPDQILSASRRPRPRPCAKGPSLSRPRPSLPALWPSEVCPGHPCVGVVDLAPVTG